MAPPSHTESVPSLTRRSNETSTTPGGVATGGGSWRANATPEDFILEGWSEGFMVGALIIMACITIANVCACSTTRPRNTDASIDEKKGTTTQVDSPGGSFSTARLVRAITNV